MRLLKQTWWFNYLRRLKRAYLARKNFKAIVDHDAVWYSQIGLQAERDSRSRLMARLLKRCHAVEKGLTMPERRLGFGKANMLAFIEDIQLEIEAGGCRTDIVEYCGAVVAEYRIVHIEANYTLDDDLELAMNSLLGRLEVQSSNQPQVTREEYFSHCESGFAKFATSRHSVRQFSGEEVAIESLIDAIDLARSTPSACNRQCWRAHVIVDRNLIAEILSMQNGNRGFGHLLDKLVVVSVDGHAAQLSERFDLYTNGGMFAMNLCYALHHYKIGTCILNWSPELGSVRDPFLEDRKLSSILGLSSSERAVIIIGCGVVPEKLTIALSRRKPLERIMVIHGQL